MINDYNNFEGIQADLSGLEERQVDFSELEGMQDLMNNEDVCHDSLEVFSLDSFQMKRMSELNESSGNIG